MLLFTGGHRGPYRGGEVLHVYGLFTDSRTGGGDPNWWRQHQDPRLTGPPESYFGHPAGRQTHHTGLCIVNTTRNFYGYKYSTLTGIHELTALVKYCLQIIIVFLFYDRQDPVLFSGTVRRNLDPFTEYSDQQLWDAIQQVSWGRQSLK